MRLQRILNPPPLLFENVLLYFEKMVLETRSPVFALSNRVPEIIFTSFQKSWRGTGMYLSRLII